MKIFLALLFACVATVVSADCSANGLRVVATAPMTEPDCQSEPNACRWSFDLGVPASRDLFEELRAELSQCPDKTDTTRDKGVNHPDFYDAWIFHLGPHALSLSLKDKSALQQTYVVLRIVPNP